jgi:hypothetical protein
MSDQVTARMPGPCGHVVPAGLRRQVAYAGLQPRRFAAEFDQQLGEGPDVSPDEHDRRAPPVQFGCQRATDAAARARQQHAHVGGPHAESLSAGFAARSLTAASRPRNMLP